jgi:hypothetical protein
MAIGRMPREEDGQHYSQSYTQPSDQMNSYPGGIRPAGYVGMECGPEMTSKVPATGREADVCEVHHVGGPTNSNYPKHGN